MNGVIIVKIIFAALGIVTCVTGAMVSCKLSIETKKWEFITSTVLYIVAALALINYIKSTI